MKKLLTTATILAVTAGTAFADVDDQSVLERVMSSITATSMTKLNGVFANIAESYSGAIDGSITNSITGLTDPTAAVGSAVMAVEQVTVDIGNLSTTVLGAVNTGETTLGVNQDVTEAIAGSSSAVSNAITQLGGSADTSALVLNVASNVSDVTGSVKNTFTGLNGSVGNVATTVLGAVNTGTITSGINAAVSGVQSGITGTGH